MRSLTLYAAGLVVAFASGLFLQSVLAENDHLNYNDFTMHTNTNNEDGMSLGAFSVSLSVKDLQASKQFYEHLGFTAFGGSMEYNYLIMKNGNALVGLFQGMFSGNMLTFNPGWDENAKNLEEFDDVRVIQQHLKSKGIALLSEADEKTTGPASLMLKDPDGNVILIDQHR